MRNEMRPDFKDPGQWSSWDWNPRSLALQSGTLRTELSGRWLIL